MPRVWPYYLVMLFPGQRQPMSSASLKIIISHCLSSLFPFWCFIFLSHAVFCQPFAATPIIFAVFGVGDHDDVIKWKHFPRYCMAICAGNSPVTGEFPAQRSVMRSFDVFFDLRLNKRLSKQSWDWWFETPPRPFWRHCNVIRHQLYAVRFGVRDLGCVFIGQLWLW